MSNSVRIRRFIAKHDARCIHIFCAAKLLLRNLVISEDPGLAHQPSSTLKRTSATSDASVSASVPDSEDDDNAAATMFASFREQA
ncbi:hypothetical protein CVT25_010392 [Psilocybe cyanescens]|uniref:Uncharacterized protein n=1 Tax=Psilocybe cyanescens TaxID=93625 RepID=A0A409XP52_PSICY|nr:hypothetical protein CVT25_010392 [Psilocybe cyanescens]